MTSRFRSNRRRNGGPGRRRCAGRLAAALGAAVGTGALGLAIAPAAAQAQALSAPAAGQLGPVVTHTGKAPTGYTVTFRFYDPSASSVRVKGEWSFASAASVAADPTNSAPATGSTWQPGDFPLASPNAGPAANWPVTQMTEDKTTGVWSYTTPLPSGVFTYAFYVDCAAAAPALTGCPAQSDPANPPWTTVGSAEPDSQVYVPSDPRFSTENLSVQGPATRADQGTLTHVTYSVPGHTSPADENYAVVYTPPGYDPRRAQAYPTFYLIHGGGGNEMDWTTQGDLKNILDNLIARGQMQPMVVVMPNNPTNTEVTGDLIPYIEQRYHVQTAPSGRSFAGLSGGTTAVQEELWNTPADFGYYAVWSAPTGLPTTVQVQNPALDQLLGLELAVGKQDLGGLAQGNTTAEEALLTANNVPYRKLSINGGHNWAFWRKALADFVTTVDFRATSVSVAVHGGSVTAKVTPATAEPRTPAGTVTFELNGTVVGHPVTLRNGQAVTELRPHSGGPITAVYSGDSLYNASHGAA